MKLVFLRKCSLSVCVYVCVHVWGGGGGGGFMTFWHALEQN